MKSRLVMLMAVAVSALSVLFAAGRVSYYLKVSDPPPARASLRPQLASYLGVFEPGEPSAGYGPIASFAQAAGAKPDLAGYFSGWGEPFSAGFAQTLYQHGITELIQIDPTDASISAIAAGVYDDDFLRPFAEAVRDFRHPVVIGFGQEMNASWYQWGNGHVPAATFVAAWRHLVTLFRAAGADNVTWLWTVQAAGRGTAPLAAWWPGGQYVTWVGIDGFYYRRTDTFATVFGATIDQVRALTNMPVLLAETAVGPAAGQFAEIQSLFNGMSAARTLGLVWFDVPQHAGIYHQDWRLEDDQAAEVSFRLGVHDDLSAPAARSL
jgi:mannan endo-1,4-beta-mannosidase